MALTNLTSILVLLGTSFILFYIAMSLEHFYTKVFLSIMGLLNVVVGANYVLKLYETGGASSQIVNSASGFYSGMFWYFFIGFSMFFLAVIIESFVLYKRFINKNASE